MLIFYSRRRRPGRRGPALAFAPRPAECVLPAALGAGLSAPERAGRTVPLPPLAPGHVEGLVWHTVFQLLALPNFPCGAAAPVPGCSGNSAPESQRSSPPLAR